jgi:hypothetical protein
MQTSDTLEMILPVLEVLMSQRRGDTYMYLHIYIQTSSIQTLMFSALGLKQYIKKRTTHVCTYMY